MFAINLMKFAFGKQNKKKFRHSYSFYSVDFVIWNKIAVMSEVSATTVSHNRSQQTNRISEWIWTRILFCRRKNITLVFKAFSSGQTFLPAIDHAPDIFPTPHTFSAVWFKTMSTLVVCISGKYRLSSEQLWVHMVFVDT